MSTASIEIKSEEELPSAARRLIAFAGEKKVWLFFGEMGAGKTTFIRHICECLGVRQHPGSPTFALVNEYTAGDGEPVYHFDFYRINDINEAIDIGCEEYFSSGHLCLIEWPEKVINLLPDNCITITIDNQDHIRKITFSDE